MGFGAWGWVWGWVWGLGMGLVGFVKVGVVVLWVMGKVGVDADGR